MKRQAQRYILIWFVKNDAWGKLGYIIWGEPDDANQKCGAPMRKRERMVTIAYLKLRLVVDGEKGDGFVPDMNDGVK